MPRLAFEAKLFQVFARLVLVLAPGLLEVLRACLHE
jgi:hypothetical protein